MRAVATGPKRPGQARLHTCRLVLLLMRVAEADRKRPSRAADYIPPLRRAGARLLGQIAQAALR